MYGLNTFEEAVKYRANQSQAAAANWLYQKAARRSLTATLKRLLGRTVGPVLFNLADVMRQVLVPGKEPAS